MIIAHLIYDTSSLLACSLTCFSWYIVSVPHLHHTLATHSRRRTLDPKAPWFRPLLNANRLGLLPFVKKFLVERLVFPSDNFARNRFNWYTLRHFSALTNVQELAIDDLDIPSFMPTIRRYFGHFSPTVRSLALRTPTGSRRQIIFFIGLFQHLEDLKLLNGTSVSWESEPADDPMLLPLFAPPLRGRLVMTRFGAGFLREMIDLLGGVGFRNMALSYVDETQLLLNTCAKTLETLRLYPTDHRCEQPYLEYMRSPTNDFTAPPFPMGLDLSRNESLRTFEVAARSLVDKYGTCVADPATLSFLRTALSTITSSTFSEVVAFYRDRDFCGLRPHQRHTQNIYQEMTPDQRATEASWHYALFEVFREMHTVVDFQLVLCADVWDCVGEYAVEALKRAVAVEKAAGRLDYLPSEPILFCNPWGSMDR